LSSKIVIIENKVAILKIVIDICFIICYNVYMRYNPTSILSTYDALAALNNNFEEIAAVLDDLLSRSGSGTNSMTAALDMNHHNVQNVQDASNPTDAVNLSQVNTLISTLTGISNTLAGFAAGNQTAVSGVSAKVNWKRDDATTLVQSFGSLWSNPILIDHGIAHTFTTADGLLAGSPAVSFLSAANNNGTAADGVGHMAIGQVSATGKRAFAGNDIAFSSGGVSGYDLIGREIDINPQAGTTPNSCVGLAINFSTMECPGEAIYIEGIFGGFASTGIRVGKLNATTGAGIYGTGAMGCLVDSSTGTYGQDAVVLSNTHKIRFKGTGSVHAKLYVDSSNFYHIVTPSAGAVFNDSTDTINLVAITNNSGNGRLNVAGSAGEIEINGTKVVGVRQTGTAANATDLATAITLVNDLKAKLIIHGLII
jgi:hypothetical protein